MLNENEKENYYATMKILVSACLLGENCKYSGGNNYNQAVCDFARWHQVVLVCPEVLGGLPTPRCPAEIVQGVVTNKEGINVDREFRAGAAKALAIAKENGVELAILQSRDVYKRQVQEFPPAFYRVLEEQKTWRK